MWSCPKCTLDNASLAAICAVCEALKPPLAHTDPTGRPPLPHAPARLDLRAQMVDLTVSMTKSFEEVHLLYRRIHEVDPSWSPTAARLLLRTLAFESQSLLNSGPGPLGRGCGSGGGAKSGGISDELQLAEPEATKRLLVQALATAPFETYRGMAHHSANDALEIHKIHPSSFRYELAYAVMRFLAMKDHEINILEALAVIGDDEFWRDHGAHLIQYQRPEYATAYTPALKARFVKVPVKRQRSSS